MKILKHGMMLYDFLINYNKGSINAEYLIKDKSSKSQAISQLIKIVGGEIEINSIKAQSLK